GTSVNTTWASVDTLSQHSPEGVLGRSLASSVDTTWASVDTLSQIGQKVFWELSLVSTPLELVSTLFDLFALNLKHCVDTTWTSVDTT
ncbi:hypothetical protein Taro_019565, partial [Colocasia esculenta]|nr:hypothetical protein [Colocasia esculenta]